MATVVIVIVIGIVIVQTCQCNSVSSSSGACIHAERALVIEGPASGAECILHANNPLGGYSFQTTITFFVSLYLCICVFAYLCICVSVYLCMSSSSGACTCY